MRTIGEARRALDMMCTRVLSRETQGQKLWEKQMVQEKIADSWVELEQFRLLVLRTAWLIDKHKDYKKVRKDISAVKAAMPKVLHDIAARALHIHGSLGISNELPLADLVMQSFHVGLADGPTEVHKATLVRELLKDYQPENGIFPSYHLPALEERARQLYGDTLDDLQEMAAT
jgi:acyl-CoA dehydrogenase